ncbi:MAG: hypothetical protein N3D11_15305 [Candidatus Sumerlaeia bacterium]|nr:hypothetical protein [Candidatus Sumerlaeia bacterium]
MRPVKTFDCVRMKWEFQKQIRKRFEGLSPEAARRAKRAAIENDPILGPFLRQVRTLDLQTRHPTVR